MYIEKIASQIYNDIVSGLRGYHSNPSINLEQLQDEVVICRLQVIKEFLLKGVFPIKDLLLAINCIDVDCKSLERCNCGQFKDNLNAHFQIPQIITDFGKQAINYIGSIDRQNKFVVVTSLTEFRNKKYRKRGNDKPFVWIDLTPNSEGMLDCYIFNAPFLKQVSVIAAFKDPRQLSMYECCNQDELLGADTNISFIDQLVKDKLTKEKLNYYRQLAAQRLPNDQQYVTGG